MTSNKNENPPWLKDVRDRLDEWGFSYEYKSYPDSFGDVLHAFTKDDIKVLFLTDKGVWEVRLSTPAMGERDLGLLRACIDKQEEALARPTEVESDSVFLVNNLERILSEAEDSEFVGCLTAMGTRRAQLLFGWNGSAS
jgi:hypothetical protein